ncbi:hypothetical protein DTO96_102169 [Ephemeroptericola cinctiostellae]|uniref:Uncharacterized protein n=1 Tax=Ephemeroptericola cinctiostellae TaxID=2268024 RepID=A0A345DDH7_9BURK|nr:hypothetical protein [Ephemeroptericola cinctiostellae]AXF86415.1 hypothetical protein DTO96_102169 [Ephemeroptericola cinctiostellae]
MANDTFAGVVYPDTYEGLLAMTQSVQLINRRLAAMVGNMDFALNSIVSAYKDEDALKLHSLLDQYIAAQKASAAMQKAQVNAGINVAFPTIQ